MTELEELKELMKKYNKANSDLLEVLKHQSAAINVLQGKVHNLECTLVATAGMIQSTAPAHLRSPVQHMIKDLIRYSRLKEIKNQMPLIAISEK